MLLSQTDVQSRIMNSNCRLFYVNTERRTGVDCERSMANISYSKAHIEELLILFFIRHYRGHENQGWWEWRNTQRAWPQNAEGRDHLDDTDVDVKIILKLIRVCGYPGGLLWTLHFTLGFHKEQSISDQLSGHQLLDNSSAVATHSLTTLPGTGPMLTATPRWQHVQQTQEQLSALRYGSSEAWRCSHRFRGTDREWSYSFCPISGLLR
jgi:hypothetical protein